MQSSLIALVTDFGTDDPYVGIMKGIISTISPGSTLIDLTHQIAPGDIQRAAFILWQSAKDFPSGTIFLAVVDPGVGTSRRAIYLKCNKQIFIGPDNGLFSYLIQNNEFQACELNNPEYHLPDPGTTFHGRDIFAPAAAYAAEGIKIDQFGSQLKELHTLSKPKFSSSGSSVRGEIISSDRFGNLFTSIGLFTYMDKGLILNSWLTSDQLKLMDYSELTILVKNNNLPLKKTFDDVPAGSCAGVVGSTGLLEIVCNQDSAAKLLNLHNGDPVTVSW